jgi:hypothetical protein
MAGRHDRPAQGWLGSGRKDQRVAFIRELIGYQAAALQAGLGIVTSRSSSTRPRAS